MPDNEEDILVSKMFATRGINAGSGAGNGQSGDDLSDQQHGNY